ncbi:MAG: energy transducer TonB [Pseudomonadota bacterium]
MQSTTTLTSVKVKSTIMSVLFLAAALTVLWLGNSIRFSADPDIDLQTIELITPVIQPPPPPPPSTVREPIKITELPLQTQGSGAAIQMIEIKPQELDWEMPDSPTVMTDDVQWQPLEVNWDAIDLSQLDAMPTLLTMTRAKIPPRLARRGIKKVNVQLDILIDTEGKLTLIEIVENPHQEMVNEIKRLVRTARFTPPLKNGVPVRTRFILPLIIEL